MKAAVVNERGRDPAYSDFPDPIAENGEVKIEVTASAISRTTRSRAAGVHYDSPGALPFVPGIDGVGRDAEGRRWFFAFPRAPYGSLCETTVVDRDHCVLLPDGLTDVTAAAIANPGLSCWVALAERAKLVAGETVLVNGATGAAGGLAVRVAKQLGAKKVVATGRNPAALARVTAWGADATIRLDQDPSQLDRVLETQFAEGVDVVLDYLWGESAERLLFAAARSGRDEAALRYVEIGSVSGPNVSLPAAVLRSTAISLMGSGTGSVPPARLLEDVRLLFDAASKSGWEIPVQVFPLSDIERAWVNEAAGARPVITVGSKSLS